jgi:hypothetical protein
MADLIPYLVIQSPSGEEKKLELSDTQYSIGRLPDNDISLSEDPNSLITRIKHCILSREAGQWLLTDNSTNGTIVQWGENREEIHQKTIALKPESVILIHQWKITFFDPNATNKYKSHLTKSSAQLAEKPLETSRFIYKISQATLYHQVGEDRTAILCRPQVNAMLRYMAQKNLSNQGEPIVCEYQELISSVWGNGPDAEGRTALEVNGLARDIRKLLAEYSSTTDAEATLVTIRRMGYLLKIQSEW